MDYSPGYGIRVHEVYGVELGGVYEDLLLGSCMDPAITPAHTRNLKFRLLGFGFMQLSLPLGIYESPGVMFQRIRAS